MTKNDGGESGRVREIRSYVHTCTCMRLFFFCVVLLLDDSGGVVKKNAIELPQDDQRSELLPSFFPFTLSHLCMYVWGRSVCVCVAVDFFWWKTVLGQTRGDLPVYIESTCE